MKSKNLAEFNYVIFDLETTGLDPKNEQIIEIAGRKINAKGETIDLFHKFVNLYKVETVSEFIQNLTHIDDSLLEKEGHDIQEVMGQFLDFIDDSILVAQNAKFDMSFLMQYYLHERNMVFTRLCLDTINLAKKLVPDRKSYKLSELVKIFGVKYDADAHHRADYDVEITTEVFKNQMSVLYGQGIVTLAQLLEIDRFTAYSEKQQSFLDNLMGKSGHHMHHYDFYTAKTASTHIEYYLNKK
jgi:DNA polymerase-3 subunit alpha (Gram-positive type)